MPFVYLLFFAVFSVGIMVVGAGSAQAQSMDYHALEELFGEPVTTSATGTPQRAPDVPVTMKIISHEEIRRSGAVDIPSILRQVSGMSVWNWSRMQHDVSVRGYNQALSPRLLVLVNGRQVYNDDYGYVAWDTIPVQLNEIHQIEIVKGPNSALFGFNAVSGVVNIITLNPLYDEQSIAGGRVGTGNYREGYFNHTEQYNDQYALRVSGQAARADDFDDPADGPYLDPEQWALALDGIAALNNTTHLRVELNRSYAERSIFTPYYSPTGSTAETQSAKLSLTKGLENGMFQATVYHNNHEGKSTEGVLFPFTLINNVTVAQAEYAFAAGPKHNFRVQSEYRHNRLKGDGVITAGSEISYDVYATGGMWHWRLRDNLSWTNALRVDHLRLGRTGPIEPNDIITSNDEFDQNMTEISYNSGIVWQVSERDTLRLMTARGVQTPSLWAMGQAIEVPPTDIVIGNPSMNASVVTNYELGYDRKIDQIDGLAHASLFYQETRNVLGINNVNTAGQTSQPGNIGNSSTIGLELGLEGHFANHWNWGGNYTLQTINDDITVNQGGTIDTAYNAEESTPVHTVNLNLGYTNGPWEIDGYAHYVSDYEVLSGPSPYTTVNAGDFISLSGRVGFRFNDNVSLALSGQELNQSGVRETSAPEKERQVFLTLEASF